MLANGGGIEQLYGISNTLLNFGTCQKNQKIFSQIKMILIGIQKESILLTTFGTCLLLK